MDRLHLMPSVERLGGRLSRRSTLRSLGAGLGVAALRFGPAARSATAQVEMPSAPPATPGASQAGPLPDLTGVAPLPLTDERLATFEAYVAAKLAETHVPGAAVAVVQGGAVAFLQGFGVRELGRPAPVTADTLLRIGSVTKSFSSLLAATLVDAGQLTWETPLVDLLPDFAVADPDLTPRLTVRDAFCACTGLPRRDLEFIFNAADAHPRTHDRGHGAAPPDRAVRRRRTSTAIRWWRPAVSRRRWPTAARLTTSVTPTPSHYGSASSTRSGCPARPTPSPRWWLAMTMRSRTRRTSPARSTRCRCW